MNYSHKGEYPSALPERIRLSNGLTRTDSSSFTEWEIEDAGYFAVADIETVSYNERTEKVVWNGKDWEVEPLTDSEIEGNTNLEANKIRRHRNTLIQHVSWRIEKYESDVRRGVTPSDDISKLDEYVQKLRDVPQQEGFPYDIVWPVFQVDPTFVDTDEYMDNDGT